MKKLKHLLKTTPGKIIAALLIIVVLYLIAAGRERAKAIADIIAKIKADPSWLANVKAKAEAAGVSLQRQLYADAEWMLKRMDEYKNAWWNR